MSVIIQLRRDTAANWTSVNPTLAAGEFGLETDTGKVKFGDGVTAWASLPYFSPIGGVIVPGVVTLTDAATVAVNAGKGNVFLLTFTSGVGATRQIGTPSSPHEGQVIRLRLTQAASGGPYSVTWSAAWSWGAGNSAPSLSSTANVIDVLAFEYDAALSKWCYLGAPVPQGFS